MTYSAGMKAKSACTQQFNMKLLVNFICHCILEIRLLHQHALSSPSLELLGRLFSAIGLLRPYDPSFCLPVKLLSLLYRAALCEQKAQHYWGQIVSCCKTASGKWGYSD